MNQIEKRIEDTCQTCRGTKKVMQMIYTHSSLRGYGHIAPHMEERPCRACCKHKKTREVNDNINPPRIWCLNCHQYIE